MNRRGLLKALLAAPAAAVAAHMGAPAYMGEEIQEELRKDLTRTVVGFSDAKVFDPRPVWASISGTATIWGDFVAGKVGCSPQDYHLKAACKELAREMDRRLRTGEVTEDQKLIVEMPKIQNVHTCNITNKRHFELACGVEQRTGIFGDTQIRVGYLRTAQKIVDQHGRAFT